MTFSCPLKIQEERHCFERQIGGSWRWTYNKTTKERWISGRFISCKGCPHFLSDEEWATERKRRGLPTSKRRGSAYKGSHVGIEPGRAGDKAVRGFYAEGAARSRIR